MMRLMKSQREEAREALFEDLTSASEDEKFGMNPIPKKRMRAVNNRKKEILRQMIKDAVSELPDAPAGAKDGLCVAGEMLTPQERQYLNALETQKQLLKTKREQAEMQLIEARDSGSASGPAKKPRQGS